MMPYSHQATVRSGAADIRPPFGCPYFIVVKFENSTYKLEYSIDGMDAKTSTGPSSRAMVSAHLFTLIAWSNSRLSFGMATFHRPG